MIVAIKDMEMPKSCYECKLDIRTDVCLAFCEWNKEHPYSIRATDRLPDCPLSEVPERKKGKWIDAEWENINTGEKRKGRRCSVCGNGYFRYDVSVNTVSDIPNFCPNCGADMRGEQNENN